MKVQKAPRKVYGFTKKAGEQLADLISKKHFNHYAKVEKIKGNTATIKIHKFKEGKGRPAKEYKAVVTVVRLWHGNIADFTDFKII
ncbi:hypothetical protein [Enterococcus phage GVEsP-1]|uniref:Uncharacterized protein n=1 Tax=Enterococcus phage GVEsP-1 TaxID=2859564 RepID=A0ABX8WTE3_9CAUD|nr:hypothetical protein [Enterococcus phage GVEsP-1]